MPMEHIKIQIPNSRYESIYYLCKVHVAGLFRAFAAYKEKERKSFENLMICDL